MRSGIVLVIAFLVSVSAFGQSSRFRCDRTDGVCDSTDPVIQDCVSRSAWRFDTVATRGETRRQSSSTKVFDRNAASASLQNPFNVVPVLGVHPAAFPVAPGDLDSRSTVPTRERQRFHWRRALTESFTFLLIEQAYVVHTDFRWVVTENGIPFNHYWRDYKQSLSEWTQSGWNDGDPDWFGYIGHPIQGALTGFIQIQNDPKSEGLVFSRAKAYWKSRLKAALWNAVYSTQWNLGPLSEVTVEKYGTKARPPWNQDGSFPCNTRHCYTGVGQIDIVMTPLGGAGWLIGEDFLDQKVVRRFEESTQNRLLIDTVRVSLNPIRAGANMLHGKHPWYRASRDEGYRQALLADQKMVVSTSEVPKTQTPNHGDIFFGYSHAGASHCEVIYSGAATTCDPLSSISSNLSGWDVSVEKMYFRYFGAIADFSGQYGSATQRDFLFGLRGGASVGRLTPFAHFMIGAVQARENAHIGSLSDTSFAEDLGVGVDFRLTRLFGWRNQVDALKTGSPTFERRNLRLSSGLAVRF
jgi:hypothetical protein